MPESNYRYRDAIRVPRTTVSLRVRAEYQAGHDRGTRSSELGSQRESQLEAGSAATARTHERHERNFIAEYCS